MKALRILGIALGLVLALLAAGIGVLYALFDGEKIKGELSRVVLEQKQRKLDIAGKLELSVWPDVSIKVDRLTLSEPGGKQEFLALDSARVAVAVMPLLSKQVQVQRVEVEGLKATLVKRKDGTLNIADLLGSSEKPGGAKPGPTVGAGGTAGAPLQIDIAGIKVANAQLTWRDEKSGSTTALSNLDLGTGRVQADGGKQTLAIDALSLGAKGKSGSDAFELKLEAPRLAVSPEKAGGESLSLTATLAGSGRTVAAKLVLSAVEGNAKTLKIGKLVFDLDAKSGETTVKAHLDSPVTANPEAQTIALEKITGSVDLAHPQMPMKQIKLPLAGNLHADLTHHTAALEFATRFDESKIAAKLKVAKFDPLALGFDLDIDTLNVDKYLPPKTAEEKAAKENKLDFSALKGLDVNGVIRIGSLQVSKLKLAKLNAKINLAGGRLDVAPLTLNLYEGAASGSLSLNAAGNAVALRQNLTGISINPLMKDLANKDLVEGRGNVTLDVSSRGDSVTAMKKVLAGTAAVSLRDGAIKGINLAQSLRDVKGKLGAASGKREDSTQQAKAGDKTDFSELTASLKIANGVAHNEDLAMKSPFLRISGAGDIDLGGGQMNYLAKASVVATSAGQGGQGLDQLKGLTVPVRVTGPFENLSYKIEFGSMVEDVAKAKLEEKKQEVKTKVEDKLKDKLKGLFGR
ncbi:MAG: AsmA family protein [Sulfuritalea sp.]|jgi:AsmA protein|nr:AsmA family protein [Sulfuritalea sp.]